jgi:hypothetical protein
MFKVRFWHNALSKISSHPGLRSEGGVVVVIVSKRVMHLGKIIALNAVSSHTIERGRQPLPTESSYSSEKARCRNFRWENRDNSKIAGELLRTVIDN